MTIIRHFFLIFLSVSILSLSNGCATLPKVSEMIDEAPTAQEPRQIVSAKGLLSPEKSNAIMERLKRSDDPMDILERHTAGVESGPESPRRRGLPYTYLLFSALAGRGNSGGRIQSGKSVQGPRALAPGASGPPQDFDHRRQSRHCRGYQYQFGLFKQAFRKERSRRSATALACNRRS